MYVSNRLYVCTYICTYRPTRHNAAPGNVVRACVTKTHGKHTPTEAYIQAIETSASYKIDKHFVGLSLHCACVGV